MNGTACHPKIVVSADGTGLVSQAGGLLLTWTLRATGLDAGLSAALQRWRAPRAVHDPGKIITDLAVALALGAGERDQPGGCGLLGRCAMVRKASASMARVTQRCPAVQVRT
jgi:Transposase DDE domain group 1